MTPETLALLWDRYTQSRTVDDRNELLMHYASLVKGIVYRMIPSYRNHVEADDLIGYGILGLIDSIEKFRPEMGVKFETYAFTRVKGEIVDQIRRLDWAPPSLRQRIKKIEDAYAKLEAQHGRPATEQEVAELLGLKLSTVQKLLDDTYTLNLLYLDDLVNESVAGGGGGGSPEASLEQQETKEILTDLIQKLPEKERMVISLYYYNGLNLKEIGKVLDVTESRVSQIHSQAVMRLRARLRLVGHAG